MEPVPAYLIAFFWRIRKHSGEDADRRPHRPTLPWAASDAAALMTETSSSIPHAPNVTVTERVAW